MNITTQELRKWRKQANRREGSETLWRVRAGALIDQLLEVMSEESEAMTDAALPKPPEGL